MTDPLATYLQDHLSGAAFAVELVATLRDQHHGEPLGDFAAALLPELQADQETLQRLADRVGVGSGGVREVAAWLGEKASRLKLGRGAANALGPFEALETLALGIQGKLGLWRALEVVTPVNPQLKGTNFDHLAARALSQYAQVEERRLEAARAALGPPAN